MAKQSCLTSLQPIKIRAANELSALASPVWPAKWRVLQRAVRHLATRIDNNKQLLDEVEHDVVNYQNLGLCYLPKPKAEADNTDTRF